MKIFNRKANFNYELLEKFEAGLVLNGGEVKSVRGGHLKLEESFIKIKEGEAWIFNAHVHPYSFAVDEVDPQRPRKLLLHKNQLLKLSQLTEQKGLTIVPVSCYIKGNNIKLEIAIGKGKKKYEKRETIKKKDWRRELKSN